MSPLPLEIDMHQRGVAIAAVQAVNHRDSRHSNTFAYRWVLTNLERKGRPMIVASARDQWSIHATGPCVIFGTLDEVEWTPVIRITEPGIYPAPPVMLRSIYPIAEPGKAGEEAKPIKVVLFLNDRGGA